jgi:hypothetical protein
MSCQSCKGLQPVAPAFPPTIILSCHECQRPAPLVPMRSTFCFDDTNKGQYLTNADRINRRRAWEIFEKVENKDSAVRAMLADTEPKSQGGAPDRIFHIFENDEERVLYKIGQRAHISQYPNITDFQIPYANKPIQYTSTVLASIAKNAAAITTGPCPNEPKSKSLTNDERLFNQKSLNLYVKVSTQTGLYPKSPYKFASTEEYLMYKKYKAINC